MIKDKLVERQKGTIKELAAKIADLKKENAELAAKNKELSIKMDRLKEEHDVVLKQYMEGIQQMNAMIDSNKELIKSAALTKKLYESRIKAALSSLDKTTNRINKTLGVE